MSNLTAEMNSEGYNYLKTKVSGQFEDFFKNQIFF
jgi:hypothetical protein